MPIIGTGTQPAADNAVVHNTGAESVAGVKTFTSSPVVPTPTTGDSSTKAASTAYADTSSAAAAANVGLLLNYGQKNGAPKRVYEPARAAVNNLWTLANFYTGATLGENCTALNTTQATSWTSTGTGSNTRVNTRIALPLQNGNPGSGNKSNAIQRYRLTWTMDVTLSSGSMTMSLMPKVATTFNIQTGTGGGEQTILQYSVSITGHRSTFEFDFSLLDVSFGTPYVDICHNWGTSTGTATMSNVTLVQIEELVPPLIVGWTTTGTNGAAPGTGSNARVLQPIGYTASGTLLTAARSINYDSATNIYPLNAYQNVNVSNTPTFGEFGPQKILTGGNNNMINVVTKGDGTTEFRGNVHGGEAFQAGAFSTVYRMWADYYDGNGWTEILDTFLMHRCWRVKIQVLSSITRSDQGSPYCNITNTHYLYADGTWRLDRTVTFLQDQVINRWYYHMTTMGNQLDLTTRYSMRLGCGQNVLERGETMDLMKPPTIGGGNVTTAATGGTIPASLGTPQIGWSVRVTALSTFGESTPGDVSPLIVTSGTTSTVTATWSIVNSNMAQAPTGFNIYFGPRGAERYVATVGAGVTTYTITAMPSPTAAFAPKVNTAWSGVVDTTLMKDSPVADWSAVFDPITRSVYSLAVDRDQILTQTGVAGIRGTIQSTPGVNKNYWHLNMAGPTGDTPYTVPNGTSYTSTLWFFNYVPADETKFEAEQTIRAANLKNLGSIYSTA